MSSFSSVDPLFTNISYGNAWLSPSGGKNIKINSKSNNKWLQFQSPLMLTFGISDFISVENVLSVYLIACAHDSLELENFSICFICNNEKTVYQT